METIKEAQTQKEIANLWQTIGIVYRDNYRIQLLRNRFGHDIGNCSRNTDFNQNSTLQPTTYKNTKDSGRYSSYSLDFFVYRPLVCSFETCHCKLN